MQNKKAIDKLIDTFMLNNGLEVKMILNYTDKETEIIYNTFFKIADTFGYYQFQSHCKGTQFIIKYKDNTNKDDFATLTGWNDFNYFWQQYIDKYFEDIKQLFK